MECIPCWVSTSFIPIDMYVCMYVINISYDTTDWIITTLYKTEHMHIYYFFAASMYQPQKWMRKCMTARNMHS